ncbi:hypothetical protein HO173_005794 [Letharia columbiana]|uniref:Uncharacterized protein n=1 Tax=Letharia columbiana TaxID=112416 RepID=A0A8H6L5E8_9LECA|nr:uncharacterized protein HO173_005794 [Letharia columbiana]KAF6236165.1 hypothetical protein HO173_005794 [Letharia columbiana]
MNQWEGTIIRASSSKIQTFLGLSNSVHDRDVWQQFLRLSKDFHDQLGIDTICAWGSMEPNVKVALRRQLKELCFQKGLFTGRDVEPALEWRLYQLQRNRRAEARKVKPTTESVSESSPTANTQDSTSKVSYYDPVRDT